MRKISLFGAMALVLFSACQQNFKKGEKGLEYKIFSDNKSGPTVKMGEFMQVQLCQIYNNGKKDSVMNDTRNTSGPVIESMDTASIPPAYFKILSQLRKGDSLVLRLLTDSMFSQSPGSMPPYFQKGKYFITTAKVMNIFQTREQVDSAVKGEMALAQIKDSLKNIPILAKDTKILQDYFTKNKINALKAPLGTYVEIIKPGTGAIIDTSVVVKTNYTGRTLAGKMFDSNTDTSKGHVEPFMVNMTDDVTLGRGVIKGWTDGMKLLSKGAVAKFYIPSTLAYGSQQVSAEILPNSILIFDIEVVDVLSRQQTKDLMEEKMAKKKLKQKQYMDSVSKLNKATPSE